ncbi:hypothetical protein [Clostridium muellerianum]|nr:hypothetical protein [Clostridium muellerianum]
MDWLSAMNEAVKYMEDNITKKFDIEKVAKIALSPLDYRCEIWVPIRK